MSVVRSGLLAAWGRAWIAGAVSLDQALDAVTGRDAPHEGVGPGAPDHLPLRALLVAWRRDSAAIRVTLPAPGDVRGLPGPAALRAAALACGEAVVVGDVGRPGLAAVPDIVEHAPSSRPTSVLWRLYATEPVPVDHVAVPDAQYELTTAIRESATALAAADVARWSADVGTALQGARRAGDDIDLPPGHPTRAIALLVQAERLQAVLDLASADPIGGAVDRFGIADRADALRPLATAVRRARVAAYNASAAD